MVEAVIGGEDVPDSEISDPWMLLPVGKSFVNNQKLWDLDEKNNAIEYHLQIGNPTSDTIRTRLGLFLHLVSQRAFDVLRTKEQLGYVVSSSKSALPTTLSFCMLIQSERSPIYLENRIDAFLESYIDDLNDMGQEDFETRRAGLTNELREKLENLEGEYARFSYGICSGLYDFTRSRYHLILRTIPEKDRIVSL